MSKTEHCIWGQAETSAEVPYRRESKVNQLGHWTVPIVCQQNVVKFQVPVNDRRLHSTHTGAVQYVDTYHACSRGTPNSLATDRTNHHCYDLYRSRHGVGPTARLLENKARCALAECGGIPKQHRCPYTSPQPAAPCIHGAMGLSPVSAAYQPANHPAFASMRSLLRTGKCDGWRMKTALQYERSKSLMQMHVHISIE